MATHPIDLWRTLQVLTHMGHNVSFGHDDINYWVSISSDKINIRVWDETPTYAFTEAIRKFSEQTMLTYR